MLLTVVANPLVDVIQADRLGIVHRSSSLPRPPVSIQAVSQHQHRRGNFQIGNLDRYEQCFKRSSPTVIVDGIYNKLDLFSINFTCNISKNSFVSDFCTFLCFFSASRELFRASIISTCFPCRTSLSSPAVCTKPHKIRPKLAPKRTIFCI